MRTTQSLKLIIITSMTKVLMYAVNHAVDKILGSPAF
jgi:hypothetical protein